MQYARGGATPGRARSNDLAGRSTALAPPCLLLCFGISVGHWGSLQRYLDFRVPTSKGSDGRWRGEKGKEGEGTKRGNEGKGGRPLPPLPFAIRYATGSGEPFAASGTLGDLTWLEDFLTSKWPGSFTALAPPLQYARQVRPQSNISQPYYTPAAHLT